MNLRYVKNNYKFIKLLRIGIKMEEFDRGIVIFLKVDSLLAIQ